jgi:hypothetical protein
VLTDGSVGNAAVGSEAMLGSVGSWSCRLKEPRMSSLLLQTSFLDVGQGQGAPCVLDPLDDRQDQCGDTAWHLTPEGAGLTDGSVGKLKTGRLASEAGNEAGSVGKRPSVGNENCNKQAQWLSTLCLHDAEAQLKLYHSRWLGVSYALRPSTIAKGSLEPGSAEKKLTEGSVGREASVGRVPTDGSVLMVPRVDSEDSVGREATDGSVGREATDASVGRVRRVGSCNQKQAGV